MMSLMDKSQMTTLHIQGKSNREIVEIMEVSRNTVSEYIRDYKKLQEQLTECDPGDRECVRELTEAITAEPKTPRRPSARLRPE